jgi:gliding motility-associated lipoprotein GldH
MKILLPSLALLVLTLSGCRGNVLFEDERDIAAAGWSYRDTVDFRFEVTDTAAVYNLYLEFEHADTFAFQNVYLKLSTRFPDGRRMTVVRSFDLFDGQGDSYGRCSGGACSARLALQEDAFFEQAGEYALTLQQHTRRDPLPGMGAVGLVVEKTEKRR